MTANLHPIWAAQDNPLNAVVEKFEEKATPLVNAAVHEEPDAEKRKQKKKKEAFFWKIQKDRESFYDKQRARKSKFLDRLRQKGLAPEEQQARLLKFNAKELERRKKFAEKMNKKMIKHAQAGTEQSSTPQSSQGGN